MVHSVAALGKILTALKARESARRWETIGKIALGIALTFIMPMFLSGMLTLGGRRGFGLTRGALSWSVGTVALGIMMVIAYGMEWWYRGSYLLQRLRDIGPTDPWRDSWNSRYWQYEQRAAVAWMEIFMFVPRLVFEGWGTLRASRLVAGVDREKAAGILEELQSVDHAFEVETLRGNFRGHTGNLAFDQTVAYLVFYEWVAVSENGQRVWMGKISREALATS